MKFLHLNGQISHSVFTHGRLKVRIYIRFTWSEFEGTKITIQMLPEFSILKCRHAFTFFYPSISC
jgi:hypothetical protein